MSNRKKPKSPYQRYGKTPYRYSGLFYRWRHAVLEGDYEEAATLSREHSARFLQSNVPEVMAA